ncbi:hypothetical protein EDI_031450 [Entamoeba dispar SAW760]|uniref:V-type proton ATPase subunit F n=1 Tax=Entamoeba dispar (strain ATCC PRA-260 / SAW760) TaxID=370354 RepID=B0EQN5_ENTDS|nr:uncharacterized protein EDI_031450 [Entamoeba dispar SAW760]EDR23154.1 hypothetical protein EDI_031450 [Entamoeba dispar SAW760]|eukprot:EDR23154.1 hypothetical protein EDI_031450 [Entamoeba dispar SAW760]
MSTSQEKAQNQASQARKGDCQIAIIGDEDSVTGFLLAGIGSVDRMKRTNFLIVDNRTISSQKLFKQLTKKIKTKLKKGTKEEIKKNIEPIRSSREKRLKKYVILIKDNKEKKSFSEC